MHRGREILENLFSCDLFGLKLESKIVWFKIKGSKLKRNVKIFEKKYLI